MSMAKKFLIPGIIVVLLAVAAFQMFGTEERKHITAQFPRTVSIYEGSDVRVLGVSVGTVDTVEPTGTSVKVTLSYDESVNVPADAKALIVAPSVVGDRFVQLTPVYKGGAKLEDGAELGLDATSTPLELDEIYQSLDDLTVALGPDGANSDGALTELLDVAAKNFDGQGEKVNQTITDLGKLTGTLDNNKDDIFGTARQLQRFISTLSKKDGVVRDFNASLASVSELLSGERDELATSLSNIGTALGEVKTFVQDNKELLGRNVKNLNQVSKTLVKRRGELDEILRAGPLALNNLALTYNPEAGTLDAAANLDHLPEDLLKNPALLLCSIVGETDPPGKRCDLVGSLLPRTGALTESASDPSFN
ncbi:MAG: MCE family protein, partial [Nocardioides sp.]|nr:MCE family protein [Nocardioides sp.]